jgi:hypothetical protein
MKPVKIYVARSMSFRDKAEVKTEALADAAFLRAAGFDVLCPVAKENIENRHETLLATRAQIDNYWPQDKAMIRESDVLFHVTPHLRSDGAWHEVGYKRYHMWEPVVHIYPPGKLPPNSAISFLEDDCVVDSWIEAVEWTYRVYGTPWKRFKWKIGLLNKCFVKYLMLRLNWIFK